VGACPLVKRANSTIAARRRCLCANECGEADAGRPEGRRGGEVGGHGLLCAANGGVCERGDKAGASGEHYAVDGRADRSERGH